VKTLNRGKEGKAAQRTEHAVVDRQVGAVHLCPAWDFRLLLVDYCESRELAPVPGKPSVLVWLSCCLPSYHIYAHVFR